MNGSLFPVRWWNRRGVPWVYLSGHFFGFRVRFKFPPDWWWNLRYCSKGTCAYGDYMCPNGCPDWVEADV